MTLTVVSNPTPSGQITCEPSSIDGRYYPSDNVTLTAVPGHGYLFVNWTGDVSEVEDITQSTIIVHMDRYYSKDVTLVKITANFVKAGSSGLPTWSWAAIDIAVVLALGTAAFTISRLARRKPGVATDS